MVNIGSRNIRVSAQEWKGRFMVHIRSYYEKDGEMLPGKGIALSMDEWKEFQEKFEEIKEDIKGEVE